MPAFLIPLAGAAVAGGTALAKGLAQRQKVSQVDKAREAELARLAALGQLGLTDEELAAMRSQRLDPLQAQQAEAQKRMNAQMGMFGEGASIARNLAAQDQQQTQVNAVYRDLQARDVAEASAQKEEQRALQQSLEQQMAQRKRDTALAIIGGVDAAAQTVMGGAAGDPGKATTGVDAGQTADLEKQMEEAQRREALDEQAMAEYYSTYS